MNCLNPKSLAGLFILKSVECVADIDISIAWKAARKGELARSGDSAFIFKSKEILIRILLEPWKFYYSVPAGYKILLLDVDNLPQPLVMNDKGFEIALTFIFSIPKLVHWSKNRLSGMQILLWRPSSEMR